MKSSKTERQVKSIYPSLKLIKKIDKLAKKEKRPFSAVCIQLIEKALGRSVNL